MTDAQMAADHEQDYREKAQLDALRMQIEEFLKDPPRRSSPYIRDGLGRMSEALAEQSAQIVKCWD